MNGATRKKVLRVGLMTPRKTNGAARATFDESADFHAMEKAAEFKDFESKLCDTLVGGSADGAGTAD